MMDQPEIGLLEELALKKKDRSGPRIRVVSREIFLIRITKVDRSQRLNVTSSRGKVTEVQKD